MQPKRILARTHARRKPGVIRHDIIRPTPTKTVRSSNTATDSQNVAVPNDRIRVDDLAPCVNDEKVTWFSRSSALLPAERPERGDERRSRKCEKGRRFG